MVLSEPDDNVDRRSNQIPCGISVTWHCTARHFGKKSATINFTSESESAIAVCSKSFEMFRYTGPWFYFRMMFVIFIRSLTWNIPSEPFNVYLDHHGSLFGSVPIGTCLHLGRPIFCGTLHHTFPATYPCLWLYYCRGWVSSLLDTNLRSWEGTRRSWYSRECYCKPINGEFSG